MKIKDIIRIMLIFFWVKFNELFLSYKGLLRIEYVTKYFFALFMHMDPSNEMGNFFKLINGSFSFILSLVHVQNIYRE